MEYVSVKKLKKNPNNPRIIKDKAFLQLKDSLLSDKGKEHFEARPCIVSKRTGYIIAGNTRFQAAKELGWEEVPVVFMDLTEEQENEIIIRDNVSNGEWDWSMLANEWDSEKLQEWGLDVPDIEAVDPEVVEDDYEVPDTIKTDIVLGDLIEIGQHRLLCGDSTDSDQVARLMNGKKADMVFTDPPYGANMGIKNDKKKEFKQVFSDFISILPCNDNIYICSDWRCIGFFINEIEKSGYEVYNLIVWVKNLFGNGKLYHTKHEEIIFCGKGDYRKDNINDDVNVWDADSVRNFGGSKNAQEAVGHPTQKPVEICIRAIRNSSIENEIIFDGFLGSGSTMVASHQLKRKCYGMELEPKYCQVIVDRMKKLDPSLVIKRNGELWM